VTPYTAVVSARIRMLLQYRAAALAGFATQLFWGLIRVMIFAGFYASTTATQPMTVEEVVTYIWLGQALIALLPWNIDHESRQMMRSGAVAYELLRPVDLYAYWFSRTIATRLAPTLLRAMPMFLVAGLFFGLSAPASWACGLAWAVTMIGALLLGCAITTLVLIGMLWTVSGEGLYYLLTTSVVLFSGMLIPLPLFPEWAQPILNALPFRGLVDAPFRAYLGHIPPGEVLGILGHQLLWTAALVGLGRAVLARGLRRVVIQGG
jgi:viologen exporter family transport system permease protein